MPPAWRVAFRRRPNKQVAGSGNLLLGMSAHVNRDLPFVLAGIGLVKPDGTSRKADHDKINDMLNRVVSPLLAEEARRFDPTIDDINTPYGLSYTALMQALIVWRETAWRNAERLVAAPTAAARAAVAADIEAYAATVAARSRWRTRTPAVTTSARTRRVLRGAPVQLGSSLGSLQTDVTSLQGRRPLRGASSGPTSRVEHRHLLRSVHQEALHAVAVEVAAGSTAARRSPRPPR